MVTESLSVSVALQADARNVREARQVLRGALVRSGAEHLIDSATLVLSELVTNAIVHAATEVRVHLWSTDRAVRVEVEDGGARMPALRHYADTAGTGRGLQLMDGLVDRWGVLPGGAGKTVWFELGDFAAAERDAQQDRGDAASPGGGPSPDACLVTLRRVPLLMHMAWQEHASTLLREYLLHVLAEDESILENHARASAAMNVLSEQLPRPELAEDPDALMAHAVEPFVTADEIVLRVPTSLIPHFRTLDGLLRRAVAAARAGRFLSPPTQPEIDEMRQWLCSEIAHQTDGHTTATPWLARTDVSATLADQEALSRTYADLAVVDEPLLATDEASIIVAASKPALDLLGYGDPGELLGRRIIVVVPARFHQAHIAGTTLHATNGRDNLLGVPIEVPMVRSDGSEVAVHIEVRSERLDNDRGVFVARFRPS